SENKRTLRVKILTFLSFCFWSSTLGHISYSVPEELPKGYVIGNIAKDLEVDIKRLKSRKA
uniref:Cadherin N-terminal domain-containing protein n=1 Tax=Periophthalmus magnuspinnatus TaxID=409849 RepID=A0A3B4B7G5_9GOBI